ncbi:DUF4446 family protein [Lachnospiraceae bacterium JLR.KK008]
MSSALLESMGLGFLDIAYIFIGMIGIILVMFILIIVQMVKLSKLKKKYEKFMGGKDAKSLEEKIASIFEINNALKAAADKNKKEIRKLSHNMEDTYQKSGIVKYDAFQQMGGKMSFSLALLNKRDDGFIINTVHSSDGCYSYTKEIHGGKCDISLGEEEERALRIAIGEE